MSNGARCQTDIKDTNKRTVFKFDIRPFTMFDVVLASLGFGFDGVWREEVFTIRSGNSLEFISKTKAGKLTTGTEEASGVSSSVVCKTVFDTVAWELMGIGSTDTEVTNDARVEDLDDNIFVTKARH